jgi:hypothetical protein
VHIQQRKAAFKLADPIKNGANRTMNGHFRADHDLERTKEKEATDLEQQSSSQPQTTAKTSVYQSLGWLDRLLALWILLAIIIGIVLGNYVDSVGPALQRGKFVQVSVPIGMDLFYELEIIFVLRGNSCWFVSNDVPDPLQSQV